MNNTDVTGLTAKKKFEHARGPYVIPPTQLIGERSEPLSMVFNDQPRDIYIYIWRDRICEKGHQVQI